LVNDKAPRSIHARCFWLELSAADVPRLVVQALLLPLSAAIAALIIPSSS
jgi:hypothetical protein